MNDSQIIIEELKKKNHELIGKIAILQKQFEDALVVTHTFDRISAKNTELEKEIHNYISKNDDLERRIQILSQTNSELTKKYEEEKANGQSHLRCQISELQDQLQRSQADHEKEVSSLHLKIDQTQKEHSFVVENYQKEIRRIYDAASQFLGTPIRETDTLITSLLSKANLNSAQASNPQNSLPCPQCIHAKVDVRSKDQSLKIIRSEIKSLKNKTSKLNSIAYGQAQSIENLENEKAELLEANKCLHNQLEDTQKVHDEQIKEIMARHKKLKSKLANTVKNEKTLEQEKINNIEQINTFKKLLSEKEDEKQRLNNEIQQLKDQIATSESGILNLKEKCKELNDALQRNNKATEESQLEAKNSQNALQALHRLMDVQKEEIMNLQSQRMKLISHLQVLNSTLCQYEKLSTNSQSNKQKRNSQIDFAHSQFPSDLNDLLSQISMDDNGNIEDCIQKAFSTISSYFNRIIRSQNESIDKYKNDLQTEKMRLNQIVDNFNQRIQNSFDSGEPNYNYSINQQDPSNFNPQGSLSPDANLNKMNNNLSNPNNHNNNNNNGNGYNSNEMNRNYTQSTNYNHEEHSGLVSQRFNSNQSLATSNDQSNLKRFSQAPIIIPDNDNGTSNRNSNIPYPNNFNNNNSNIHYPNNNANEFNPSASNSNNPYPSVSNVSDQRSNNFNSQQPFPNEIISSNEPYQSNNVLGFNSNSDQQYPNNRNPNYQQQFTNGNNRSNENNRNNSQQQQPRSNDNTNNYIYSQQQQQFPNSKNLIPNNRQQQFPNSSNNHTNPINNDNSQQQNPQQFPNGSNNNSNSNDYNNNQQLPQDFTNNSINRPYPNNVHQQPHQQCVNGNNYNTNCPHANLNSSAPDHQNSNAYYQKFDCLDKITQNQEKLIQKVSQKENDLHEIFAILHVNCFLDAKACLEQLQSTIQILQAKLRAKKDKMKELVAEYQQYQTSTEEKLEYAQKAINKMQKKLQENDEVHAYAAKEYEKQIGELVGINNAAKEQIKQMKVRIEQKAEKNSEDRSRLEDEIQLKQNENIQLLQKIEELRNEISKKEVVIQQLRSFTKYFAKKQSQKYNNEQEIMKNKLSQIIDQLKTKNVELKKSLGEVKEKMNSSELQYSKAKRQISDYCSKIQELEVQLESIQNEAERGRSLIESKHKAALISQETELQSHIEDSKYQIENAKREIMAYVGLQFCSFFNAKEQIDSNNFESFIQRLRLKFESLIAMENNLRRMLSLSSNDSVESAVSHLVSQKKL